MLYSHEVASGRIPNTNPPVSASLVREARRRAGLTQTELAARAGTTQSDIARLESGRRLPTLERVRALAGACGFELALGLRNQDDDWAAVSRNLALSVEARWDKTVAAARFVRTARTALPAAASDELRSH